MGAKTGTRMPAFCLNRIRPSVKVRSTSILQDKPSCKDWSTNEANKNDGDHQEEEGKKLSSGGGEEKGGEQQQEVVSRKIMVVIDSSGEAKLALQWALTHTVQKHDTLVLVYPTKITTNQGEASGRKLTPKIYEVLHSMKKMCHSKIPEVQVEITVAQGKEKGPAIVEEARKQGVSLLILGQKKKPSITWSLMMMWAGSRQATTGAGGLVEYCVQNATCMAFAVRRRSKKIGGYLITTKRHKDFWLLA